MATQKRATLQHVDFFVEWFLISNGHEPDVIYQVGAARQQLMPAPLPWQHRACSFDFLHGL